MISNILIYPLKTFPSFTIFDPFINFDENKSLTKLLFFLDSYPIAMQSKKENKSNHNFILKKGIRVLDVEVLNTYILCLFLRIIYEIDNTIPTPGDAHTS